MGLSTVFALAEQLDGKVRFVEGAGVECRVAFRKADIARRI
jgi:two-component sensor histidine kinase